jgi:hypothetical protein
MTMTPHLQYPGLEMDDQPSPLPVAAKEKDTLPRAPVRKVTPVPPARSSLRVVGVATTTTSEESPILVNPLTSTSPIDIKDITAPSVVDYDYSDAIPDTETPQNAAYDVYGYESGSPDVSKKGRPSAAEVYGYEYDFPDPALGDANFLSLNTDHYHTGTATNYHYDGTRVPRRSSLKAFSSYGGEPLSGRRNDCERRRPPSRRNSAIEVRVRGEPNPVQRRRSIDFANKVRVKEIESVKNLTDNIRDLWLQADDFAQMKEHRRSLLQKYKHHNDSADTTMATSNRLIAPTLTTVLHANESNHDDSFRGLERYIDKSGRRQKNMAWDTVLLEQDEQECSGYFDEYRIAELYKYTTQESPEKAFARAQQDREAVQEYLTSPRTSKLMARTLRRVSC